MVQCGFGAYIGLKYIYYTSFFTTNLEVESPTTEGKHISFSVVPFTLLEGILDPGNCAHLSILPIIPMKLLGLAKMLSCTIISYLVYFSTGCSNSN